jgi:hypothetical protein
MPAKLTCPACAADFRLPDDLQEAEVHCPHCQAKMANPTLAIQEPPVVTSASVAETGITSHPPAKRDYALAAADRGRGRGVPGCALIILGAIVAIISGYIVGIVVASLMLPGKEADPPPQRFPMPPFPPSFYSWIETYYLYGPLGAVIGLLVFAAIHAFLVLRRENRP